MSTITTEQQQAIADYLKDHVISRGVGSAESACSITAINLALSGKLTDRIPDCMSLVIGRWVIVTQDAMAAELRNSAEWKALLPFAAGTGREREAERLAIVTNWMWDALALVQPIADANGFGAEWSKMCEERTPAAAEAARAVAWAAEREMARAMARVAREATWAAAGADGSWAARAATRVAKVIPNAWEKLDPVGLLRRLIEV